MKNIYIRALVCNNNNRYGLFITHRSQVSKLHACALSQEGEGEDPTGSHFRALTREPPCCLAHHMHYRTQSHPSEGSVPHPSIQGDPRGRGALNLQSGFQHIYLTANMCFLFNNTDSPRQCQLGPHHFHHLMLSLDSRCKASPTSTSEKQEILSTMENNLPCIDFHNDHYAKVTRCS